MINIKNVIKEELYIENYRIAFVPSKRYEEIIKTYNGKNETQKKYIGTTFFDIMNKSKILLEICNQEISYINKEYNKIITTIGFYKYSHQIYLKLYKVSPELEFLYLKFKQYRTWINTNRLDKDIDKKGVEYGFSILENQVIFQEEKQKLENLITEIINDINKSISFLESCIHNKNFTLKNVSKVSKENFDIFNINRISDLTYATLEELQKTNKKISRCNDILCNKWFLVKNKRSNLYCDNLSPQNNNLTCRQFHSKAKAYSKNSEVIGQLRNEYDRVKSAYYKRLKNPKYDIYKNILENDLQNLKSFYKNSMASLKIISNLTYSNELVLKFRTELKMYKQRNIQDIKKEYESQN